ncbi:hypothetical protein MIR68_000698 [Amoeboaphelidium protococcarum]|nr:hypothetical protein MIR68_000698 [Amoeboaphelidium protococcarum]
MMVMMQTGQSRALILVVTFQMLMMMCTVDGGITASRFKNFRLDDDDDDKPQRQWSYRQRDMPAQQEQIMRSADIQSPQVPVNRLQQQQQRGGHSARQQSPQPINTNADVQEQSGAQAGVNHDYYCTAPGRKEALTQFQSLAIAFVKTKNVEFTGDMEGLISDMYEHIEMSTLSPIEKWNSAQRFHKLLNLIITDRIKPEKSERLRVMKVQSIVSQQFRHIRGRLQPAALIAQAQMGVRQNQQ